MKMSDENNTEMNDVDIDLVEKSENSDLEDPEIEHCADKYLLYGVNDTPPVHITLVCALQQGLLSLSWQLIVSLLVAEAVCASDNQILKARLLSSTLFMSGVTTVVMNLFGFRLPLFQGATSEYVIPLLLIGSVDGTFCSSRIESGESPSLNSTLNFTSQEHSTEKIIWNIQVLQGSLMVAGLVHAFIGFTGLIGLLLKFIGPLTIVPTMTLLFISFNKAILKYVEVNWGIAMSTVLVAVILFLYLGNHNMPIPIWTPSGGFRMIHYPLHQVFAILISVIVNWIICGILTSFDVLPNDPESSGYNARTDARSEIISDNPWFTFPYPGQYGTIRFSGPAFLSCMIATLISILDSIGDYYACARVCRVPAPPRHAVNRGIMIEGLCSFFSGTVGCGHATTTYGGNIGAIGVSKVASRKVFLCTGTLYMLFGVFGKFSAVFITIPYPVLGGAIVVMFGIFFGVTISNLEVTNMSSPRNIAIIGLSINIGLCVPTWVQKVKTPVQTGNAQFDSIMAMLLGNPNLVGTILACFLDNTVPGSDKDRGIAAWHVGDSIETEEHDIMKFDEGCEVYTPFLPKKLLSSKIAKKLPFLPYRKSKKSVP